MHASSEKEVLKRKAITREMGNQTPRQLFENGKVKGHLVNLLHGALARSLGSRLIGLSLLLGLNVLVNVQAERDKLVNALGILDGLIDGETRDKQRGLEEEKCDGLDGTVLLTISLNLALKLLDDSGLGRDLEGLLGRHVRAHGCVTKSLSLHDTLHVSRPTELAGTDGARRTGELVRDNNLLNLLTKNVLEALGKALVLLLLGLTLCLLLLGLLELEVLGDVDKLLAIEFLQLGHGILVNGVNQEENLEALVLE